MSTCSKTLAGRYRLQDPVGRGGMGVVWAARDDRLGRTVAVKQITPPPGCPPDQVAAMCRAARHEARMAACVTNPHVVPVYDLLDADGLPWIVMEYVPSRTLHEVLRMDGPRTPAAAATIGLAVLDGLRAAHRAGIIHCDVAPRNILLGHDGRARLTDFGLARFIDDTVNEPELRGTAGYVAPERAYAGTTSVAGDLWALGAVLYTMVEGRAPHARDTVMETLVATATRPPDPHRRAGRLAVVLDQLLQLDPTRRPCADTVEGQLRAACAPGPVGFVPANGRRRPGGRRPVPDRPEVPRPLGTVAGRGAQPIAGPTSSRRAASSVRRADHPAEPHTRGLAPQRAGR